jgi:hypothetical protein
VRCQGLCGIKAGDSGVGVNKIRSSFAFIGEELGEVAKSTWVKCLVP